MCFRHFFVSSFRCCFLIKIFWSPCQKMSENLASNFHLIKWNRIRPIWTYLVCVIHMHASDDNNDGLFLVFVRSFDRSIERIWNVRFFWFLMKKRNSDFERKFFWQKTYFSFFVNLVVDILNVCFVRLHFFSFGVSLLQFRKKNFLFFFR